MQDTEGPAELEGAACPLKFFDLLVALDTEPLQSKLTLCIESLSTGKHKDNLFGWIHLHYKDTLFGRIYLQSISKMFKGIHKS